jgi:hypothetical protein
VPDLNPGHFSIEELAEDPGEELSVTVDFEARSTEVEPHLLAAE